MSTWYLDTETTVILAGPHCKTALFELIGLPWVDKICAYINILDVHLDVYFYKAWCRATCQILSVTSQCHICNEPIDCK